MAAAIPLLIQVGVAAVTYVASSVLAPKPKLNPVDKGRFDDIRVTTAEEGGFIPLCFGTRVRLAGNIIWGTVTKEYVSRDPGRTGGKGGGAQQPTPPTNTYSYKKSFAIAVCGTPVRSYRRISENLEAIYNSVGSELRQDFYEAENHTAAGGAVVVTDGDCSGGRAVRLSGSGQYVEFEASALFAGLHTVSIFYKATSSAGVFLSANGGAETSVSLPATGSTPASVSVTLSLHRGVNTIKLRRDTGTSDVDRFYVSGTGVIPDPDAPPDSGNRWGREVTNLLDVGGSYPSDPDNSVPYYNTVQEFDGSGYFEGYTSAGGQARFELFAGVETQPQSAIIVAVEGAAETPAFRDVSYFATEDYLVKEGQLGSFIFEIEPDIQVLDETLEYLYTLDGKVTAADCDFSLLAGRIIPGLVIDHRAPLSETVAALESWFNFDIVPRGGKITAIPRGGAVAARLYERELRAHLFAEERPRAAVKVTHEDPTDLPGAVDVLYLDPAPSKDFHTGNQTAEKTVGFAFDRETLTFPIVGDADTAHAVGQRYLDARHLAAKPAELVCGFGKRHFIPTDILEVELEDLTLYTYRVASKQADLQGMVKLGVVPERASIYGQGGAGVTGRGGDVLIIRSPANTMLVVADCVPVRQEDLGRLIAYGAACPRGSGSWPGYHLNKRDQNGEVERVGGFETAATIGVVETASQSAAKFGLEAARTFTVKLYNGSLESRTEEEARAERVNLALYGSGNRWEVIQFLTVTAQTPTAPFVAQYLVTGTISGLYGTETNSATHQANDYFVLFDGAVASFPMRPADITQTFDFIGQTAGQALPDAEVAGVSTLTFQGNARKPLAVSGVEVDDETQRAPRDSEGSILVAPRPRINAETVGDEYLIDYLSDDRSTIIHSASFGEGGEVPALFKSTASLYSGAGPNKYAAVTGNTLSGTGDDAVIGVSGFARARSLQRILRTDNYVEATLTVGSAAGNGAMIGLISERLDWTNPTSGPDYYQVEYLIRLYYSAGYHLVVYAGGTSIYTLTTGAVGASSSERVCIRIVGAVVRFYRYTAAGLIFLCETPVPPSFPLRAWAALAFLQSGITTAVEQVMLSMSPMPSTILTGAQQTLYYGGLKNPVQVNIYQHSGDREVGYGQPWEGAI